MTDLTAPLYYLSGPADMVVAMTKVHEDHSRTEEYSGYYI
jgi:hypothetical protein